ncbi:MAG: galactose mutarotase [Burkholderiaceae bacterium]|nr:galactose mutarotase [Burkholderiaceae bacterium]
MRLQPFGRLLDGTLVEQCTLANGAGMEVRVLTYGGIIASIVVPDREGRPGNVVLGFDHLADYVERSPYFGAIAGRYANRIANARFTLDGKTHVLNANEGRNTLHGGRLGFDKRVWNATPLGSDAVALERVSADGEEGFPGRLEVRVVYTVTPEQELRIHYTAVTDRATVVNLTSHSYFNLAGAGTALDHRLTLFAEQFTPIGPGAIPSGELMPVHGTPFDFRSARVIGERIREAHPQLLLGRGYDHNWVLAQGSIGGRPVPAARLEDARSGRVMEILTTEPAIQFYSGNHLDGTLVGSGGQCYRQGDGVCLETQHHPDAPNQPHFPSTVLRPGEVYRSTTVHRFSVMR